MRFKIFRSSEWCTYINDEKLTNRLGATLFEYVDKSTGYTSKSTVVEINNLEELAKLYDKAENPLIIDFEKDTITNAPNETDTVDGTIEIYNTYRE